MISDLRINGARRQGEEMAKIKAEAGGSPEAGASPWELLERLGLSEQTDLTAQFAEPRQAEKSRAMLDLLWAMRLDDVAGAQEADAGLAALGVTRDERGDVSHMPFSEIAKAGAGMVAWLVKSPWLAAREAAITDSERSWRKSAVEELASSLATHGNREGFDQLIESGAMTLEKAFVSAGAHHSGKLALRYGQRMLASGKAPGKEALDAFCEKGAHWFDKAMVGSAHPLEPFLRAWGGKMSQSQREGLWKSAIGRADARAIAALGRCGIEPEGWRLEGNFYLNIDKKEEIKTVAALDFAIAQSACWRDGTNFLKGLMSIEGIANQAEGVHPYALSGLSNTDLETLVKLGARVDGVDWLGRNVLHVALHSQYSRPSMPFLVANAKRFPDLWGREDNEGKTPLELLKKDERKQVDPALSAGEKTALGRELIGRRGAKTKRRPGL